MTDVAPPRLRPIPPVIARRTLCRSLPLLVCWLATGCDPNPNAPAAIPPPPAPSTGSSPKPRPQDPLINRD